MFFLVIRTRQSKICFVEDKLENLYNKSMSRLTVKSFLSLFYNCGDFQIAKNQMAKNVDGKEVLKERGNLSKM